MLKREYIDKGGILVFDDSPENSETYDAKGLDQLFQNEEKHFWFLARKNFIGEMLSKYVHKDAKIMEVGAGTGNVTRHLMGLGYKDISVGELHYSGLKYAKSYGVNNCYQFDLLNNPFESEFDAVCLFDVLEHFNEDMEVMQSVSGMLKDKGKLAVTVPAHKWLWCRDDKIAGHRKRYTLAKINELFDRAGFDIIEGRYFFISILPLLLMRRFIVPDSNAPVTSEERSKDITMNGVFNRILLNISLAENKINKYLPNVIGGSIFVIGGKK